MEKSLSKPLVLEKYKYRNITIALIIFTIFITSVLSLNVYSTANITKDLLVTQIAHAQRADAQSIALSFYQLAQLMQEDNIAIEDDFAALVTKVKQLDKMIAIFAHGGVLELSDDDFYKIEGLDKGSKAGQSALKDVMAVWTPFKNIVLNSSELPNESEIQAILKYLGQHASTLFLGLAQISHEVQRNASNNANALIAIEVSAIVFTFVFFSIILVFFFNRLRLSDRIASQAQKETQVILDTVSEGLFLLDKDYNISNQHSKSMSKIFGKKEFAKLTFSDLIKGFAEEKTIQTAQEYISLMFQKHVKQKLIKSINPLEEVKISAYDEAAGINKSRYISFDFARVIDEETKRPNYVLVTTTDITEQVALKARLKLLEEETQEQIDMFLKLAHIDADTLQSFLYSAQSQLLHINEQIKTLAQRNEVYHDFLIKVFPLIHTIKGNAGLIGIDFLKTKLHAFESQIKMLQGQPTLDGKEMLKFTISLNQVLEDITAVYKLAERMQQNQLLEQKNEDPLGVVYLKQLLKDLSTKNDKEINLILQGLDGIVPLDPKKIEILRSILAQLMTNAVMHGIENKEDRGLTLKKQEATIKIIASINEGKYILRFIDDGRGISAGKIREHAIKKYPNKDFSNWSKTQLYKLLFTPGFSTASTEGEEAGRGMGMSAVQEALKRLGGEIKLSTQEGEYTIWQLTIPLN